MVLKPVLTEFSEVALKNWLLTLGSTLCLISPLYGSADETQPVISQVTATRDLYPDWSPDGNALVFNSDRNSGIGRGFDLYRINVDGSGLTRLTKSVESEEAPVWSPDGTHILFSAYLTRENSELFIIDADGGNKQRVTDSPGRDGHAKFAPDGNSIIFNSQRDEAEGYEIYEMSLADNKVKRLTDFTGWDTYPDISPDGKKIVWRRVLPSGGSSSSGRNSEIFIMNRDGSGAINISNHQDFDGYPSWSPDGNKIIFASNRGRQGDDRGNFHIYTMNPDGSNVKKLIENGPSVEDARPRWSKDGKRIVFNRQYVADNSSIDILVYEVPEN